MVDGKVTRRVVVTLDATMTTATVLTVLDPCPSCGTTSGAQSFLDHLTETVDLATARSVLLEIITLADHEPVLTDEQLRFRLLALGGR